jgi:hypothetical protein
MHYGVGVIKIDKFWVTSLLKFIDFLNGFINLITSVASLIVLIYNNDR